MNLVKELGFFSSRFIRNFALPYCLHAKHDENYVIIE